MDRITLRGITWNHSRGITPLMAAAQRFSELNPGVEITWDKRSLQEFADYPIEKLTETYDLLIIDHPWAGRAAATRCVLPLEEYLPAAFMDDQLKNSVGCSHISYQYDHHQWALAVDAATPVASYRADIFNHYNIPVPTTWNEVLALAKKGKVAVPAIPVDLLMNFYMFCIAEGQPSFEDDQDIVDAGTGLKALETMKSLWSLVDKKMFGYNPINIAELMTTTDDYWYCPFAYGYSNYSRKGYARHLLTYTDLPVMETGLPLHSTIGGTGLAVSASSAHREKAVQFAAWIASGDIQSTLYVEHGGQPGHRTAWLSAGVNRNCNNFFRNTLVAMDRAYLRPRYNGYLFFQDHAGTPLHQYLLKGGDPAKVLEAMNAIYHTSRSNIKNL